MSWHDIHAMVRGPAVQDFVRHVVQRWNYTRAAKGKLQLPVLLPHGPWPGYVPHPLGLGPTVAAPAAGVDAGTQTGLEDTAAGGDGASAAAAAGTIVRIVGGGVPSGSAAPPSASGSGGDGGGDLHARVRRWLERVRQRRAAGLPPPKPTRPPAYPTADARWYCSRDWTQQWLKCNVQVLRSASDWSVGTSTETSIYHAYVHAILNAEHHVSSGRRWGTGAGAREAGDSCSSRV
jgi:phosphatidylserine/phosphatidylglycerophosphate/cardiolipin synthase-like enzyme